MSMEKDDLIVVGGSETLSEDDLAVINADITELGGEHTPEKKEEQTPEKKEEQTPEQKSESDTPPDDEQLGPEHDDKTEEEREAIRARRRKERADKKQYAKQKEETYKREIAGLKRQLSEFNEWKNTVERRNVQSGMAQLDQAIHETDSSIQLALDAIKEATVKQNGEALADAQELFYASRKRKDELEHIKKRVVQQNQQPQRQAPVIDRDVVKNAQNWMKDKDWYDPRGANPDSKIAAMLDSQLSEEGWDPRTPEYWQELDERAKKYLPHRYNSAYNEPTRDKTPPKPPTGGSGKENRQTSSSFTLSPERVRALKEAGMWDDPTKRKAMILRYMEQDKQKGN